MKPGKFQLQRKSSLDGAWELYTTHDTAKQAEDNAELFREKFANGCRVVGPDGVVIKEWGEQ